MKLLFACMAALSIAIAPQLWGSDMDDVTFILVRHGETDWNLQGRVQGKTDVPLNETGVAQAKRSATFLKMHHPDIQAVYSSDLLRAYATAWETASKLNLEVQRRKDLQEIYTGTSEGMLIKDKVSQYKKEWQALDQQYPEKAKRWDHTPVEGEETLNELMVRIKHALKEIARIHSGQKVAVFTHGKVIGTLLADIKNNTASEKVYNGELITITYSPDSLHPFKFVSKENAFQK